MKVMNPRCQILVEYAKWTALSAVRSGCPIKGKKTVNQLLNKVGFAEVLSGKAKILLDRLEIPAEFLAHVSPLGWAHNQPDWRIPLAGHRPTGNAKRLA